VKGVILSATGRPTARRIKRERRKKDRRDKISGETVYSKVVGQELPTNCTRNYQSIPAVKSIPV
jgi:hypothetical protein